jgi:hypothetical protein
VGPLENQTLRTFFVLSVFFTLQFTPNFLWRDIYVWFRETVNSLNNHWSHYNNSYFTDVSSIKEASVIEALRGIKNRKGPIPIHCWKGSDRTGLTSALYRIIFDGWTKENAIRELEDGGFGFHNNVPNGSPIYSPGRY